VLQIIHAGLQIVFASGLSGAHHIGSTGTVNKLDLGKQLNAAFPLNETPIGNV
jgi:hypothetical protein